MAKFLIANLPVSGHVKPCTSIAKELLARGHEVRWYTGNRFKQTIESMGATFIPMTENGDFNERKTEESFPERIGLKGLKGLKFDFKHIFIDSIIPQRNDLLSILKEYRADMILSEPLFFGSTFLPKNNQPILAGIGVFPLGVTSRDTAPFGTCLPPKNNVFGVCRNKLLNQLSSQVIFRDVQAYANEMCKKYNLPSMRKFLMDDVIDRFDIYLQGTAVGFEYPRTDLAKHIHFIGPLLPEPDSKFTKPAWWNELKSGKPVIFVTQGTIASDSENLLLPTFEALKNEDVLVIATSSNRELPIDEHELPDNVRIEAYIPYEEILPFTDIMITNAGYGGVQFALKNGVPLIVSGQTEEKGEICARVSWSKVGITIKPGKLNNKSIKHAVNKILNDPNYRNNSKKICSPYQNKSAAKIAADMLEQLIHQKSIA